MRERNLINLTVIIILAALAAVVVAPFSKPAFLKNVAFWQDEKTRDLQIKQGLDLKGGLQVLLSSNLPEDAAPSADQIETARRIVENRVNGLGANEPIVQIQGNDNRRILVEMPGITDKQVAIDLIQQTGQLEFVDAGNNQYADGTVLTTSFKLNRSLQYPQTSSGGLPISGTLPPGTLQTAFTGEILQSAAGGLSQLGEWIVNFQIKPAAQASFGEYTSSRVGQALCIVLDQKVLSCPTLRAVLREGGQISGSFNKTSADNLALTLSYGSLPVPLKIETTRDIGATLGKDSIRRSVIAGIIALAIMVIFLSLYYRLPGILGSLSILFFAVTTLALFVLIPITLTLPGIAGFVLSIATAADANILVFERFKEELRAGRSVRSAVEYAFQRAWSSIRDSNTSTLIVCLVLFIFGGTFGASAVRGFALNLAIGIAMSLFSCMFVTRTLMRLAFASQNSEATEQRKALLGV